MALEDYKDLVASIAGVLTIGQMFSGLFICKDIFKQGSTKNIPGMPFIGGFVITILFLQHGLLLQDTAMGIVNFVGIALNLSYLLFYYLYCDEEDRKTVLSQLGKGCVIIGVLVAYAQWEDTAVAEHRFGIILTILLFALISHPLFSLGSIIRNRDLSQLPFPMIVSGTAVSSSWLLYGVIIKSNTVIWQNVMMLVLSVIQLSLFAIVPRLGKPKSS